MLTHTYDVVVVGASCAGLQAAYRLAAQGQNVAVFERQAKIGELGRTWIVTDSLGSVSDIVPPEAVVHKVDIMEMFSHSQANTVKLAAPDLIVERRYMQLHLAQQAEAAGAKLFLGCSVSKVKFEATGVTLEVDSPNAQAAYQVRAQTLIGADGVKSSVARLLGAGPQKAVPIVQARVRLPAGYDPRKVRIWFDRSRTRFFYWLIPESNDYAVAGLVAETSDTARHLLDEFLVRQRLSALNYQGAMIPLHQPFRQIEWRKGGVRALLVGDAAAHVKVTTVGGLVSGLWGANAAAQSILNDTSYWREITSLHKELYLHDLIRWMMDRFSDADYDQMLLALGPRLKAFLSQRNRDSMALAPLALLLAQPSLALLAARALVGRAPTVSRPATSKRVEALSSE